jgi:hypothetical protein
LSINKICFAICILCIVAGSTISILAIWGVVDAEDAMWKSLATIGVVFSASLLTVLVNRILLGSRGSETESPGA